MGGTDAAPFVYPGGEVPPGETENIRFTVSETYLGDPVRVPVTIINGARGGPTACLTAASHGDELNGTEVVRTVAQEWDHDGLRGTIVCLPVLNVPGFLAQQRYLPIIDRDLNRSFPGKDDGTSAQRIAQQLFDNFIAKADLLVDFHTSTRGRNNMLHVLADLDDPEVERLARSFATNVIIEGEGPEGSLRREAVAADVPAIAVEMGQAHRFQREVIERALAGVESAFAEFGLHEVTSVDWPGWRTVIDGDQRVTWLRAGAGGMVDMQFETGALVHEEDVICTITNPFMRKKEIMRAPFTGLLVGVLENPVVYPGNPICRLVEVERTTRRVIEAMQSPAAEPGRPGPSGS